MTLSPRMLVRLAPPLHIQCAISTWPFSGELVSTLTCGVVAVFLCVCGDTDDTMGYATIMIDEIVGVVPIREIQEA